ncbi:MAG: hypothetical protein HY268_27865 [Deltaproteobacteria bacterium]|nr:hypothetical protein [Deltaproteobacteria bacterium]
MLTDSESKQKEHPVRETKRSLFHAPLARIRADSGVAATVAITAVLYGILVAGRLAYSQWDPTFFIVAGRDLFNQSRSPQQVIVLSRDGYDGQYCYGLALDPFTKERERYGITVDNLSYRGQRILYPVLAHVLALGRIGWVPWSLIVVNYLTVCWLALSAARLAKLFAVPAIYGLAIAFLPGVILGLARDLSDPLAISLMVFSLLLLHSRRSAIAAGMLALAVLARETVVLLAGALFFHSVWQSLQKQSPWSKSILFAIPVAAYVSWQLCLRIWWGEFGFVVGRGNLDRSFSALLSFVVQATHFAPGLATAELLQCFLLVGELLFLGGMVILAAIVAIRSAVDPGVKFAWLMYMVLAMALSKLVWVEDWAFMRGCGELLALGILILMGARDRRFLSISLVSTMLIWLVLAERTLNAQ